MKKKNQGFTLVELIVTIAILALAGIGIGTIISQALKHYRISNAEVNLQEESQLVGNQLMNLVIDANDGVSMSSGKLNIYHYDDAEDVRSKTVIAYQEATHTLTYTRYTAETSGSDWLPVDGETEECLAEYVTGFSVKLFDAAGKELASTGDRGDTRVRQVQMKISYELDGESYAFDQTVTLRNEVLAGSIKAAENTETEAPPETGNTETENTETETGNTETENTETETGNTETENTETETGNTETENTETETETEGTEKTETRQVRIYLTDWQGIRYDASATLTRGWWSTDKTYWFHIEAYDETSKDYQEISWSDEFNAGHIDVFFNNSGNTISNKDTCEEDGCIIIRGRDVDRKTYPMTIRYNGSGGNPKENPEYEAVFTISTE